MSAPDVMVVDQWKMNPYFQVFCGEVSFQTQVPCHATELVKFRNRIGSEGVNFLKTQKKVIPRWR
ncbi:MAG: hypothetical protein GKR95_04575 [Gammaproteobacteria bacterium]|nr:hypothetical protein [Gammaproteobacteria bacterium]